MLLTRSIAVCQTILIGLLYDYDRLRTVSTAFFEVNHIKPSDPYRSVLVKSDRLSLRRITVVLIIAIYYSDIPTVLEYGYCPESVLVFGRGQDVYCFRTGIYDIEIDLRIEFDIGFITEFGFSDKDVVCHNIP